MEEEYAFDPEHLIIAFHRLQPELLLNSIRTGNGFCKGPAGVSSTNGMSFPYHHYAMAYWHDQRTDDEVNLLGKHFAQRMASDTGDASVFELLRQFSRTLLTTDGTAPLCKYDRVLRWRMISLPLGQDLLTTAYTASEDLKSGRNRKNFIWPATINTNNTRLSQLAERGLAENHFHLTGSTRMFSLSWACMMNHPAHINIFFRDKSVRQAFHERLNLTISGNPNEHPMPWESLVLYAAFLRAKLFTRVAQGSDSRDGWVRDFFKFDADPAYQLRDTRELVESLRFHSGAVSLPQRDKRDRVLDYALTYDLTGCCGSENRMLAGERHFLYLCFRNCFSHRFTPLEQDCFYLYLLIQNQFRSEIIQVNGRIGFQNFARYQDRKGFFWESFPEYWDESIRLSVNSTLKEENIRSLEARITPAKTASDDYRKIRDNDSAFLFAMGLRPQPEHFARVADTPLFYVFHFPKNTAEIPEHFSSYSQDLLAGSYPRNSKVRRDSEIQARSLARALSKSSYLRKRVRGIDACSNEIGCRPEAFATEFRFLRSGIPCSSTIPMADNDAQVHLNATYHVGEDFVDVLDGLRAIDEAVRFLELCRGDRLGHALALGIDPKEFYRLKHNRLALPRQDLLDNLTWIYYRAQEYGVKLSLRLCSMLGQKTADLMDVVGYGSKTGDRRSYYFSWQLRGDHPSTYWTDPASDDPPLCLDETDYENFRQQEGTALNRHRQDSRVREFCYLYHFDKKIKDTGKIVEAYHIDPELIDVIEILQNKMQHDLMEQGIGIECNPSSNVLIGSFKKYRDHPLFRFNRHNIRVQRWEEEDPAGLCVSINTDDQGVFDTSLENEYAYVARCLERELDGNGNRLNSNDEIYDYLEHLRVLGNSQSFHYKGDAVFQPAAKTYAQMAQELAACTEGKGW